MKEKIEPGDLFDVEKWILDSVRGPHFYMCLGPPRRVSNALFQWWLPVLYKGQVFNLRLLKSEFDSIKKITC